MTTLIRKLTLALFCAATATVSCGAKPEPPPAPKVFEDALPPNAVLIKGIPPLYAEWFGEVKECAGGSRVEFDAIKWYAVVTLDPSGFYWRNRFGQEFMVAGLAYSQKTSIVMGDRWLLSAGHIRHELLHLIASPKGHDPELYQRKCRHLVVCYSMCLTDTLNVH